MGERPIPVALVDARERELRSGPLAARLPPPGGAEGRNLRRWLVQMLVAEALVEQEAAALGLPAAVSGSPPAVNGPAAGGLTLPAALRSGGVAAALLVAMPLARAVRTALTAGLRVPEEEIRAYYDRNLDRFTRPEVRYVTWPGGDPLGPVRRGELPSALEDAVFRARPGEVAGPLPGSGGPWTLRVDRVVPGGIRPYRAVRAEIAAELGAVAADRAFAAWLDRRHAERVRLAPGYEHPADPRHPDATHHH
ncbi:malonyl CoA-ACP transacylase [Sphaerisporangium rufum]|uniref:Malonyl CoA-ACP transacylase n=1 Tax=Sphaerisporangium rufum TaxID=1381558 RepID=A0A919R0S3_9ACTN|nr:peptidylprolyl isomerase [Sphaerisporangium rufum]GII76300.1 malonyl CoA-ACP transacylase [Sphaerisporangium rufum]